MAQIKLKRGTASAIANSANKKLESGQPLYNLDKNYITVGKGNTNVDEEPITTRSIKGYFSDSQKDSRGNEYTKISNSKARPYYVGPAYIGDNDDEALQIKVSQESDIKLTDKMIKIGHLSNTIFGGLEDKGAMEIHGDVTIENKNNCNPMEVKGDLNVGGNITGTCDKSKSIVDNKDNSTIKVTKTLESQATNTYAMFNNDTLTGVSNSVVEGQLINNILKGTVGFGDKITSKIMPHLIEYESGLTIMFGAVEIFDKVKTGEIIFTNAFKSDSDYQVFTTPVYNKQPLDVEGCMTHCFSKTTTSCKIGFTPKYKDGKDPNRIGYLIIGFRK